MRKFQELGIKPESKGFTGDKIKINRILNKEITVHGYKIEDSKFDRGNKKCLHLSIAVDGQMHVVFTGSGVLMDVISRVPQNEFPFTTTIIKENERFEFS
jgi:hypothetical protein